MVIMPYIIWIDEHLDNEENFQYSKVLESIGLLSFRLFKEVDKAINHMKFIKFYETKVIISGRLYSEFVKKFKENILDMYVAPKIIVFTKNQEKFIQYNREFKQNHNFFSFGGIATNFDDIKIFLKKEIIPQKKTKADDIQLEFEYIDNIEKLVLPIFFKFLIDNASIDNMEENTKSLYNTYSKDNDELRILLGSIKSMVNIPIEILSKYYTRLYTIQSNFYKDINKDIGLNKKEKYLSFVKILYEGVKLKSLPLVSDNILYRGSIISNIQVKRIRNYLMRKIKDLPGAIVFSKSFLSFSKERGIAEKFFNFENKNQSLSKVLYILEKENNIDYKLSTHADIEEISYFPNEREVLFFPYSSFEIKEVNQINIGGEKGYEIKLLYLDKYLKEIENNNIINKENKIPDSEFKKYLCEFGLIRPERIKNINPKKLYKEYKKYEEDIEKENEEDTEEENENDNEKVIEEHIEENKNKKNYIIGEINITSNNVNEEVQIINSFENRKRIWELKDKEDDYKYENEVEIKENTEIKINGKEIEFSYSYIFNKEGRYVLEYFFKKPLSKTNCLFYDCNSIIYLDLSNFNTQNVTNMSDMFYQCNSLVELDLSNFKTKNVTNMSYMFNYCKSLTNLDLSSFNTQIVTNMSYMFSNCHSLTNLDLSSFNTKNVTNMSYMFSNCNSLKNLELSNFNTKNVTNMSFMFFRCTALTKLSLLNTNTNKVTKVSEAFYNYYILTNLNLLDFNTKKVTNMSYMFSGCKSLKILNLKKFNTKKVTNMSDMFYHCNSLTDLDLSNFNTQNVTNMNFMFSGCNSLKKENIITQDNRILSNFVN